MLEYKIRVRDLSLITSIAFFHDGCNIISAGGPVRIHNVGTGLVLNTGLISARSAAFSHDDLQIVWNAGWRSFGLGFNLLHEVSPA